MLLHILTRSSSTHMVMHTNNFDVLELHHGIVFAGTSNGSMYLSADSGMF
jgi:hypothetical protein